MHHHNGKFAAAHLLRPERIRVENPAAFMPHAIGHVAAAADMGCGPGFYSKALATCADTVYCVDSSMELLDALRKRMHSERIGPSKLVLLNQDASSTSIRSSTIDAVVFANSLHDMEDRHAAAKEAHRILKPGGKVIIVDWKKSAPADIGPPPKIRMSASEYASIFGWLKVTKRIAVGPYHFCIVMGPRQTARRNMRPDNLKYQSNIKHKSES